MKKVILLIFTLSFLTIYAEKQDSIGVEKKGTSTYVQYLVSPGETIYHLSTTHKVAITDLFTDNPGLENGLKVGQVVLLRKYIRTEPLVKPSQFDPKQETHVVQKGETYYGLSQKYGIPMNELLEWNGVGLKEGQALIIKKPEAQKEISTTKPVSEPKPSTAVQKPISNIESTSANKNTMGPAEGSSTKLKPQETNLVTTTPKPITKPIATKPIATETKPIEKITPVPPTATTIKTAETPKPIAIAPKVVEPMADKYEFDPNKQQVLVVPFDPHLYWSDADDEIMKGSNLTSKLEVRKTIRRRLNALLDPMGYENIHLLGGKFQDTLTDLNKIYTSVSYDYQAAILSEEYKKTLAQQETENKKEGEVAAESSMKTKLNAIKNKVVQPTTTEEAVIDKNADKYFGVIIKDPKFFEYFNTKYSIDYYIFINQFEIITDYDHCLDRTTENYVRYFVVHFSIFDKDGKQIAGNKYKQLYNSNSNNIDRITGDNLQKLADRILLELPVPNH